MSAAGQAEHQREDVRLEWIRDESRLQSLRKDWRALNRDPFTSPEWLLSWWGAFADGRQLCTGAAWRDDELVGLIPMAQRGSQLESLTNVHTPYYDVIVSDPAARAQALCALLEMDHRCIVLDALPRDSPTLSWLQAHHRGRLLVQRRRHVSPFVDTSVDVDAFRAATRSRWGAPLDRFRRKMVREQKASFHLIEQPDDLESVLDQGFAVEASGWKGQAGTAVLSDSVTTGFYRGVAREFAAQGQLALSWVSFGDQIVAFDLDLLLGGRLYLLKTGFDERFRRLAPGLVLRLAVIERCIELGLSRHELLGGDSEWKRKFAQDARAHSEVRMYRPGPRGAASWTYRRLVRPGLRSAYQNLGRRPGPT
ncbi:MAG: GNAT family N-acetyltransferase [Actinomycetota bacterium]|nr:GNAT family N-acetyltransferase [Actinomycetota bacterium]